MFMAECTVPKTIIINAANLHGGGGVQVAISFLDELARLEAHRSGLTVLASDEVAEGLSELGVDVSVFRSFEVVNSYGPWRGFSVLREKLKRADLAFTLFGPLYQIKKPNISIVGFAQPWIAYPDNEVYNKLSYFSAILNRIKFAVQKNVFKFSSDFIVVESENIRDQLISLGVVKPSDISVVSNCISGIYQRPDVWRSVKMPVTPGRIRLGIVTRDYLHKNLDIIPAVKACLEKDYGIDSAFFVTFKESEWIKKSDEFRNSVLNIGVIRPEQCPSFYQQIDAVFFPSLLECFSATPLEALASKKPLFASDRPFVSEYCGNIPMYFDPNSPADAARVIAEFVHKGISSERVESACQHVRSLPGARDRALAYLQIVERLMAGKPGSTP